MKKSRSSQSAGEFQWSFLLPRYWLNWLAIIFIMLLAIQPWSVQWRLAHILANMAWTLLKSRRETTLRNLEICFPEKSEQQIVLDAKQVFLNTIIGIFEALNAWYKPQWFKGRVHIHGEEHLPAERAHGILLLGTHTTLLDAGGFVSSLFLDLDVMYRPQNNKLFDMFIYRCRATIYKNQIARDDLKKMVSYLKKGHAVWYSPDQDFGLKQGVMAPFFGVQAATLTAHRRLMQITKAIAIPLYFYRDGSLSNPQYHVLVESALDHFPSNDEVRDATRVNKIIENQLKTTPLQYMWFHRRFKTRAMGQEKIYK